VIARLAGWALLILMSFCLSLAGPFLLLLVPLLGLALLLENVRDPAPGLTRWRAGIAALVLVLVAPVAILGLMAPLRAIAVGTAAMASWLPLREFFIGSPAADLLNAWHGVAGALFATVLGVKSWRVARLQTRQLENLPTARVRAAAMGLSEFRGIARRAPGHEPWPTSRSQDGHRPGLVEGPEPPLLVAEGDQGWITPFHLDDGTGTILVDPRGASFWDGLGHLFWQPLRTIHLVRGSAAPETGASAGGIRVLAEGDRVHVVGSVEALPRGQVGGASSLVVRPARRLTERGFTTRWLLGGPRRERGRDLHDVFYLTNASQSDALTFLEKGRASLLKWLASWLGLSLPLVVAFAGHLLHAGSYHALWRAVCSFLRS
jgi:hypothetical protein